MKHRALSTMDAADKTQRTKKTNGRVSLSVRMFAS